jgi:hypothetical protein
MSILKNTVSAKACCSSQNAHAYAYNISSGTVPANGPVTFDHVGDSQSIYTPGTNGNDTSTFTILSAGFYYVDYLVKGIGRTAGVAGTDPLFFRLVANGQNVQGSENTSQDKEASESSLNHIVRGSGIFFFPALTKVQLFNATGSFQDTVDLVFFPAGGLGSPAAVNASFTIFKICG